MKHKISAKRLSDTLFEIAKNNDSIEQVKTSIIEFDNILRTNNELKSFVQSKRFSQEQN
jgi:F0F1-type ATP synthase delta subunit